ncbi:molecular chaperone TorD family protein [Ideonella sp. 4Y16]|uniref:Molecular chaperone TorD family protein n=1 Tax=Ideonella alba TaxID=2824118 RepID=A0A940YBX1_9BURK|nr:molecular chaperone TorD family protein [Ideonella alba]MBQ0929525.1 molecular chaperone TorD family protein [Ideonella alba]MBQ0944627.1 molecular chaperone TorD family protein [Ideonella alba]
MSPTDQPIAIAGSPDAEEVARAELYGLLARLWLAPPDEALLREFAVAVTEAPQEGGFLESPWQDLVGALRSVNVAQATETFDALFGGVGKPEVFVYGSFYQAGFLNETPLVRLREDLARLGLTRTTDTTETEDHIAYGFEVMRYLIGGDDAAVCNLEQQRRFFRAHLQPWVAQLCDTVQAHPGAGWLAALAGMTRAFIEVETQAFDMVE